MEMDVFTEKLCEAVQAGLGMGYRVMAEKVRKNNGVYRSALIIRAKNGNVSPAIYLEDFLEAYNAGLAFDVVAHSLVHIYQADKMNGRVDMEFFRHFEMVKDRICYKLVGRKGNRDILGEVPHKDFLDLAVCFYYAYESEGLGSGSILIHNSHMEMWGTCTEALWQLAYANTQRLFPWRLSSLRELMGGGAGWQGRDGEEDASPDLDCIPMKILSNTKKVNGAASILYPGVQGQAAKKMGGSYYILPCSLHELILFPYDGGCMAGCLKQMIAEINRIKLEPEEVLSDSLYYYDAGKKRVELA